MRVLCVGGSGYVGRLAVPLLRQRFAVPVFDLRASDGDGEYVPGDATGRAAVLAALTGVDAVIHGAMAAGDDAAAAFGASVTSVHQTLSAAHHAGVPHAVYLTDVGAAIATALSYRDGLQIFTISADELAGRWSTAKARHLLTWHPRLSPGRPGGW
jgi:nucleoside-diphosphate-sugar epimerase